MRKRRHREVQRPGGGDGDGRTAEPQPREKSGALEEVWAPRLGLQQAEALGRGRRDRIWAAGDVAGEIVVLGEGPPPVAP